MRWDLSKINVGLVKIRWVLFANLAPNLLRSRLIKWAAMRFLSNLWLLRQSVPVSRYAPKKRTLLSLYAPGLAGADIYKGFLFFSRGFAGKANALGVSLTLGPVRSVGVADLT